MDRLHAMNLLLRVVDTGSFAAAAEQLGLARSQVTRQVAALEAHLGAKLLTRSTRHLALTPDGEGYLEKCREILGLVEQAEAGIGREQREPRGLIRLAVPMSFGLRHLMPLFDEFMARYPLIELAVEFNDRRINLVEEGMQLAIRISRTQEPSHVARQIGVCRLVVVAAPGYLALHGRPRHPEALAAHQCLSYSLSDQPRWRFVGVGAEALPELHGRFRANSGDALNLAAIRGLGLALQPTFIAAEALRDGRLERVLADFPLDSIPICAVFPGRRHIPHRVRLLVDFLAERLGPAPAWDVGLGVL